MLRYRKPLSLAKVLVAAFVVGTALLTLPKSSAGCPTGGPEPTGDAKGNWENEDWHDGPVVVAKDATAYFKIVVDDVDY